VSGSEKGASRMTCSFFVSQVTGGQHGIIFKALNIKYI